MVTSPHPFPAPSAFAWVLIIGGAGFATGFFGPLIFAPDANQGPLVGILISGPGGVVLGGLLCAIFKFLHVSGARQWQIIGISSVLLVIVTSFLIMPKPVLRGDLEEVQIDSCGRPMELWDQASAYWERQLASRPEAARPGWKEDSREMLQDDDGVVLEVDVIQTRTLRAERKPWNSGHIQASEWQPMNSKKSYYARYAGGSCSGYAVGMRAILFQDRHFYGVPTNLGWPPKKVSQFLDLQTLDAVPDSYRIYIKD
jgi:hypothetical protein